MNKTATVVKECILVWTLENIKLSILQYSQAFLIPSKALMYQNRSDGLPISTAHSGSSREIKESGMAAIAAAVLWALLRITPML